MTLTAPEARTGSTDATPAPPSGGAGAGPRLVQQVAGTASTLIAIMLLVFVAEMVLVGPVRHAREQNVLYGEFRQQLADAVAPTGQADVDGTLLELGAPVAVLAIPAIGVREVVAEGTTAGVLRYGPGHRRDTPLPGQAGTSVIYGRQATYGGPFGDLAKLEKGDEIAVTTGQGSHLYEVTGVRRPGDELSIADPNAGRLTLVTGDGTPYLADDALRVDALLKTPVQPAGPRTLAAGSLPDSEGVMSGDTGALLPLLLWSQLLLVVAGLLVWVRSVWGRWQSWIVCLPVAGFIGFQVAGLLAQLLPNLL